MSEFISPKSGRFSDSGSPSPIPNINIGEGGQEFLSNSLDIKRQLSQSLNNNNTSNNYGGISKPQSRRGSLVPIKLNDSEADDRRKDDDDDDDQNNERKRRDNINDRIQQLLTLVPKEFFQPNANDDPNRARTQEEEEELAVRNSGTKDGKPNKGQILTKSVEYIQYLQNLIDENNRKEVELLLKLRQLENPQAAQSQQSQGIGHTSAERALGEIGVGPLSNDYFKKVLVASANSNKASQRRSSLS